MKNNYIRMAFLWSILMFAVTTNAIAENIKGIHDVKGIYITQYNFENTTFLKHLIQRAKSVGIDTFVVDLELPSKRYQNNVALLKENNIHYVARIIVFPNGGSIAAVSNPAIWQKRYNLVKYAIDYGADQIQLDYIRYSSKVKASPEHAKNILNIIAWYKNKLSGQKNIPLQVDVFGITSFGESKHIGQNIKLFSQSVDAICPMVYPSHYVPFKEHFKTPYATVYDSLTRIKRQFKDQAPIKVYAYIELSNYHYPMNRPKTLEYIKAQLRAVNHAEVNGWYAWSPHNRYDNLFTVLGANNVESTDNKNDDSKIMQSKNKIAEGKAIENKVSEKAKILTPKKVAKENNKTAKEKKLIAKEKAKMLENQKTAASKEPQKPVEKEKSWFSFLFRW